MLAHPRLSVEARRAKTDEAAKKQSRSFAQYYGKKYLSEHSQSLLFG